MNYKYKYKKYKNKYEEIKQLLFEKMKTDKQFLIKNGLYGLTIGGIGLGTGKLAMHAYSKKKEENTKFFTPIFSFMTIIFGFSSHFIGNNWMFNKNKISMSFDITYYTNLLTLLENSIKSSINELEHSLVVFVTEKNIKYDVNDIVVNLSKNKYYKTLFDNDNNKDKDTHIYNEFIIYKIIAQIQIISEGTFLYINNLNKINEFVEKNCNINNLIVIVQNFAYLYMLQTKYIRYTTGQGIGRGDNYISNRESLLHEEKDLTLNWNTEDSIAIIRDLELLPPNTITQWKPQIYASDLDIEKPELLPTRDGVIIYFKNINSNHITTRIPYESLKF